MNLKVCGHRVLILPDPTETVSKGGIITSVGDESKREKAATISGKVVDVGEQAWKDFSDGSPWAKVGDRVYFAKYSGKFVKDGDDEYVIINDEDLQCVILEESDNG